MKFCHQLITVINLVAGKQGRFYHVYLRCDPRATESEESCLFFSGPCTARQTTQKESFVNTFSMISLSVTRRIFRTQIGVSHKKEFLTIQDFKLVKDFRNTLFKMNKNRNKVLKKFHPLMCPVH